MELSPLHVQLVKMSRDNSIKGFIFPTSLSTLSVLCNVAEVTVFSLRATLADMYV